MYLYNTNFALSLPTSMGTKFFYYSQYYVAIKNDSNAIRAKKYISPCATFLTITFFTIQIRNLLIIWLTLGNAVLGYRKSILQQTFHSRTHTYKYDMTAAQKPLRAFK